MEIGIIQAKIRDGEYRFSEHAVRKMIERGINRTDVEEAVLRGEIIEEYPHDKYSPSCLIYGKTCEDKHLHVQVSLPPSVVIVTTYEPSVLEWVDYKIRR